MSSWTSTKLVCVALLPTVVGGCGLLFMQGPPDGHERMEHFTCSNANFGFLIDFLGAGYSGAFAYAVAKEPGHIFLWPFPDEPTIAGAVTIAALSAVSGVVGLEKTKKCGDALEQLAARKTQGRSIVTTPPLTSTNVRTVIVSPPADTLLVGEQVQLVATARTLDGVLIPVLFEWRSSNETIASVTNGLVTAHAVGTVFISAAAMTVSGNARLVVEDPR